MTRIAIVEDELSYVKQLQQFLDKYAEENNEQINITVFNDGTEIVENYSSQFDIVLLDIQMKNMDGMTAAEQLRKIDQNVVIIFITNMVQYAVSGYSVGALDFVLKPVSYIAFSQKMKRAFEVVKRKVAKYITISVDSKIIKIDISSITYIESMKHRIVINTLNNQYSIVGTIKSMEEKLSDENFFRSNSCYLVNLAHVKGIDGDNAVVGTAYLKISRPRYKQFLLALTNYVGGVVK